jgi:flavorubredoxin
LSRLRRRTQGAERPDGAGLDQQNAEVELAENIYWVGAVDWNVRNFHGFTYSTHRGTTYNAYLILDEKIALVDTVYGPFADEMIERIKQIIPPEK